MVIWGSTDSQAPSVEFRVEPRLQKHFCTPVFQYCGHKSLPLKAKDPI